MDEVDRRILAVLCEDGRISMSALAAHVHISRANAYARVERLAAVGVIRGFTAVLDPERAGFGTSAYVMVRIEQAAWREFRDRVGRFPEVQHVALVAAEVDVLLLVRAADNAALRRLVLDGIQEIPGVRGTTTLLVFDEVGGPLPMAPAAARVEGAQPSTEKELSRVTGRRRE